MASRRTSHTVARQACDACRVRKRKCNAPDIRSPDLIERASSQDSSQTCQRCSSLKISCTFLLPVAARGPRKKGTNANGTQTPVPAELVDVGGKSGSQLITNGDVCMNISSPEDVRSPADQRLSHRGTVGTPSSGFHPASTSPQSFHTPPVAVDFGGPFQTDSLCSRPLLRCIMSDYLDLLYPLIPVVHRPSFRRDLERSKDALDMDFLGLIVSLCAATVGTMPRKFREYQESPIPLRFKTRTEMINHCYDILLGLRGCDYFDAVNYNKWAISYLMQISFFQIGQHNRARMIEVEAMQLARLLDFHQVASYGGLNPIETQLRRKAFWLMFYGYVHGQLQNLRKERLTYLDSTILSTINLQELMPIEVDDEMIHENFVHPQPPDELSITAGFTVSSKIFWAGLSSLDPPDSEGAKVQYCNCVRSKRPDLELKHFKHRLYDLKYMLDNVPPQLRQWATVRDDAEDDHGLDLAKQKQKRILKAQFESMRANIHVTHLWLQSIILDQIDALRLREPNLESLGLAPPGSKELWAEREDICRQLLHVLHGIPEIHLEPNGHHLTYKVRDVAVTLLACPYDPQHEVAKRAYEYLREFTDILSRLDGSETINTLSLQSWVDTGRKLGSVG